MLNVRKFSSVPFGPGDLLRSETLGPRMLALLAACVRARMNIVISGGTCSGKTTLLGVLSTFVSTQERVITIEDAAELRLAQPHVIGLEARPATVEGRGEVTVRDLVHRASQLRNQDTFPTGTRQVARAMGPNEDVKRPGGRPQPGSPWLEAWRWLRVAPRRRALPDRARRERQRA